MQGKSYIGCGTSKSLSDFVTLAYDNYISHIEKKKVIYIYRLCVLSPSSS